MEQVNVIICFERDITWRFLKYNPAWGVMVSGLWHRYCNNSNYQVKKVSISL